MRDYGRGRLTVSTGVDLALGLPLLATGALLATGRLGGWRKAQSRPGAFSRTSQRRPDAASAG